MHQNLCESIKPMESIMAYGWQFNPRGQYRAIERNRDGDIVSIFACDCIMMLSRMVRAARDTDTTITYDRG